MANRDFSDLSALVVDDEIFSRTAMTTVLRGLGVGTIHQASDGHEALSFLNTVEYAPQVIFCDLQMPGMDGVEMIRALEDRSLDAALVFVSGEEGRILSAVEELARNRGFLVAGSIVKPLEVSRLVILLEKAQEMERHLSQGRHQTSLTTDELATLIKQDRIVLRYQPKVSMKDGSLESLEALARIDHPQHGLLSPAAFIETAEESGLIDALTQRVASVAIRQCAAWRDAGMDVAVAVNFSMETLQDVALPERLLQISDEVSLDASRFAMEITETRLTSDPTSLLDITTRLRLKKFELSIDDFGTGFSGMQALKSLPFTELKIDKTFVTGSAAHQSARTIFETSVDLAKKMSMRTVAEGVETVADWAIARRLGCDLAQGFLIARPMPGSEVPKWLSKWQPPAGLGAIAAA